MFLIFDQFGFTGIYVFTVIISTIITLVLFNTLLKENNNLIISFFATILAVYVCGDYIFCSRNQMFSFLFFLLEFYCLHELLKNGKKRYFIYLILIAFGLLCVHDTVYPIFFVILLPYLAEIVLRLFLKLKETSKLEYSELLNQKYLVLLFILSIFIGFCTPLFGTAYSNLVSALGGVGVQFVAEMQPVNILNDFPIQIMVILFFSIMCFTKTKLKIRDFLFIIGFLIMGIMNYRSYPFIYLIGIIPVINMLYSFLETYMTKEKLDKFFEKISSSKIFVIVLSLMLLIVSLRNYSERINELYIDDLAYPVEETNYILNNLDYKNIRIWTHYNFGSYLEMYEIPVFVDSRAEMFIEQMNPGCTVLEDWYNVSHGNKSYKEIFEKYEITHILLYNDEPINVYIQDDENYKLIYKTGIFSLYEKNQKEE